MWPMLLRMKPMNMKKRLTRGKGVAERIISGGRGAEGSESRSVLPTQHKKWAQVGGMAAALLLCGHLMSLLALG